MSLLTIAQDVARNTALDIPNTAIGSTDRAMINVVQFINDTGIEAARRVNWGRLRLKATVTGTGAAVDHTLPSDFSRLVKGNAVLLASGATVRGAISPDEFNSLTPIEGTPRYYSLIGNAIRFYPFLASGLTATVAYQSLNWTSASSALFTADNQTALFPEDLLVKGAIARQRRHVGQDFADHLAEYEAALADYAMYDSADRSP